MTKTTIGVIWKTLGGWVLVNWPIWLNLLDTWLGVVSALIGMIVLIWTGRIQIVKYRISKLELKRKIDDIEKNKLKEMLRIIDKENEDK